ncbi:hypothetical protein BCR42DRAFT_473448 [Absidia repens]|uniref:Rap-GAP domain-containing protein n=1 Tax=Absidia repens TaxID=90262 RepID=A0A1X2IUQ6_9FUNG|nr:hypothetical protein BCR42DRAFT_473448 [Absidia repens]
MTTTDYQNQPSNNLNELNEHLTTKHKWGIYLFDETSGTGQRLRILHDAEIVDNYPILRNSPAVLLMAMMMMSEPISITTTYDSTLQIYRPDRRNTIDDYFSLSAPPTSHQQYIVGHVFMEEIPSLNPAAIRSQFLYVVIAVSKKEMKDLTAWRIVISTIENVPSIGSSLPEEGSVLYDDSESYPALLAKLINAECPALKSSKCAHLLARAPERILTNIVEHGYTFAQDPLVRTAGSRHNK